MTDHDLVEQLHGIEDELRRLGLLSGPLQPAQPVHSAFGMSEMPFEHWLITVFLPRAHEASAANSWPAASHVGTMAIRNFDGQDEYAPLVTLLCEFDRMIESRSR